MNTIRESFDLRHQELQSRVVRMGSLATEMTRLAVDAALHDDLSQADQVIAMDEEVDQAEFALIQDTCRAIGLENPVANDLRFLTGTLSIVGEIEKAADHAVKLARRVKKLRTGFPAELKLPLSQIGEEARHMMSSSLRLYVEFDPVLVETIVNEDTVVDKRFSAARDQLLALIQAQPEDSKRLVRVIEVFHAVEHVADSAVAIARRLQLHHGR